MDAKAIFGGLMVLALIGWSWWRIITMPRYSRWLKARRQQRHRARLWKKKILPAPDVRAQRPTYNAWRKA